MVLNNKFLRKLRDDETKEALKNIKFRNIMRPNNDPLKDEFGKHEKLF